MLRLAIKIGSTLILSSLSSAATETQPLRLKLPTANTALITGKMEDFYMYTYRSVDGVASRPWTGGSYGYSRNLRKTSIGKIGTKFHEGIDIKPHSRDRANRPKDNVHSIADGKVVYTNSVAGRSNYGKYVVVEHNWGYGPFYSLYAHLASVSCSKGQRVKAQTKLGKMGYTGRGINIERAHLHLELNIMWHPEFNHWHTSTYGSQNFHGAHNGINMSGLDIAGLFINNSKNKNLTIPQFLSNTETYYKITIPRKGQLAISKNYPWLNKGNHKLQSPSWEISFSNSTFPLAVKPSELTVSKPTVTFVQPSTTSHSYRSRGMLIGSGDTARLSKTGLKHINLVAGTFPRIATQSELQASRSTELKAVNASE